MRLDFLARRPLFYAALIVSTAILFIRLFFPAFYYSVPPDDVSRRASADGTPVELCGRIDSEPDERFGFYGGRSVSFVLFCESVDVGKGLEKVSGRVRATLKEPRAAFARGDRVRLEGALERPLGARSPGGFNYADYLDRRGIRALFYGSARDESEVLEPGRSFWWIDGAAKTRGVLSQALAEGFGPDEAAFLKALILGERRDIDADFEDLFIRTGTLHILAVSGFNVGFLSAVVLFLLAPLRLPKPVRLGLLIAAIWAYCWMVGWQAPLVRASIMATLFVLGKILGRKSDLLNSLGLAALVILAAAPKSLFDASFQLSFAAVAGLAFFMPVFVRPREGSPRQPLGARTLFYVEELFWVSFVATFATMPLTVSHFFIVSPASLLANMIVVPLSFLLFFCGMAYFAAFAWLPPSLFFIPHAMKLLMKAFTGSLSWIAGWPGACVATGRLEWFFLGALTAGVFWLLWDRRFQSRFARAAALILFAATIFTVQDAHRRVHRGFEMTVLDVGQGDSIYFQFPEGGNMLIDAGRGEPSDQGRRVVVPFLRERGVRVLDALVISHPQADHIGGMASVLKEVRVENVFDAQKPYDSALYRRLQNRIEREGSRVWKAGRGDRIEGFRGISVEVLNPPKDSLFKEINDESLVLKVFYEKTSFLMTGDIEAPAMRSILADGIDVRADILKVPHHGAKADSAEIEFIREVAPRISVISAGRHNPFKHPRPETLEMLESVEGNQIFRTDRTGSFTLASDYGPKFS